METDEDHIHFLIKSEPKVSVLAIVRRLKQDQLLDYGELKRNIWKSIIMVKIHYGVMGILRLLSEMLVNKLPNIIYGIRVEVDAYIP